MGNDVPARAAAPSGETLRRFLASAKPAAVAVEHLHIGEQMMAEGDRLGRLQMGEAGHDRRGVGLSLAGQRPHQVIDLLGEGIDGIAHIQPEIGRHLVVARARGMQPARRLADDFGQPRLDIHVDVFQRARKREVAAGDFRLNAVQTLTNLRRIGAGDNAAFTKHCGMGLRAGNILGEKAVIEADRGIDLLHDFTRPGGKAPAPHLVCHVTCSAVGRI